MTSLTVGDDTPLAPTARFECRICWTAYDPADGDPVWQIAPGTPFAALPAHWTCPNCAATKDQFLPLGSDPASAASLPT
jgi:rubredoxin